MKLSIMQPYFLPYLGYFALARATDRFIMLDSVQYIRHGWINRNRVLHPTQGWQYVGVPLKKHSYKDLISSIEIADGDWVGKVMRQLEHYRRSAPYYENVRLLLERILDASIKSIAQLNYQLFLGTCRYLGLSVDVALWSDLGITLPEITHPGRWALEISTALGASQYVNPIGGEEIFAPAEFAAREIELKLLQMEDVNYDQRRATFEPWLSIIDVLMFNTPAQTLGLIDRHRVLGAL